MKLRLKGVIILVLIMLILIPTVIGEDRELPRPEPEPIPFEFEGIDYTPPVAECNLDTEYLNYYCQRVGYNQYCVWQTEVDEDYPCELDGFNIVCEESDALDEINYRARLNIEEQNFYDDEGIVLLDFRVNTSDRYNNSIYDTQFVETDREQTLTPNYTREGFYQVGYNSNVFYYTAMQYGSTTNTSVDINVTMSNSHISKSDPLFTGILAYYQFTEDGEDSSGNGYTARSYNGATHVHEYFSFDGVNDYIDFSGYSYLDFVNTSDYSFCMWANSKNWSNRILLRDYLTGSGFQFRISSEANPILMIQNPNGWSNIVGSTQLELNSWNHICSVWNTSTWQFYINGVAEVMVGAASNYVSCNSSCEYTLSYPTSQQFKGAIDEVIILNRTLNATEVAEIYNLGLYVTGYGHNSLYESTIFNAGEVVNWTNFTADVVNVSNNNVTFKFRVAEFAKYYEGDADLLSYFDFNYILPTFDRTKLLLELNFTDGSVIDSSGLNNDFTNYGSQDMYDALVFDGINDYLTIGDKFDIGTQDNLSASVWIKTTSAGGEILAKTNGAAPLYRFQTSSGKVLIRVNDGAGQNINSITINTVNDDEWHHVAFTLDRRGYMTVYLDGIPEDSDDISAVASLNTAGDFSIGRFGSSSSNYFNGTIDNVLLFNRTLSTPEVVELFNQGRQQFNDSVNLQTFNSTLGTERGAFYGDNAVAFGDTNGVSDNHEVLVLNTPYYKNLFNFTDDSFSINAYVKPIDSQINGRNFHIFSYGRDIPSLIAEGGYSLYLTSIANGNHYLRFTYFNDSSDLNLLTCTTNQVEYDSWTQVASSSYYNATTNKLNLTLYVNGERCINSELNGQIEYPQGTSSSRIMPCIGALGYDCNLATKYYEFVGEIDDLVIFNRTLTDDEILAYGSWTPGLQIGQEIRRDNSQFIQYAAEFNTNNLTNAPVLRNLSVFYGIDTVQVATIPTITMTIGEDEVFDFGSYFNFGDGYVRLCSGTAAHSTVSYTNCVATYSTANDLVAQNESYTLTVNNGYGATTATVNLNYTYNDKMEAIQGASESVVNMLKYINIACIIFAILFVMMITVGLVKKNKFKFHKKFLKENMIAILATLLIVSGGIWIINIFLLTA